MYFPGAGIEVSLWIPPAAAFVISFFTSMGGVSGAFLLLPFQMSFLGFTSPSVSSTNQLFNIIAIPSGVYRYIKEGRMVWPLTLVVIVGTLPGVLIGAVVRIKYLPDSRNFKLFVALVLLYIGVRLVRNLFQKNSGKDKAGSEQRFQALMREHRQKDSPGVKLPSVRITKFSWNHLGYEFYGEEFDVSTWGILLLSFVVGIVGGVYGIGGGAIIAPFFVTFFSLPVYTVAGAALMGTFVTSIAGVGFYMAIAPFYPEMSIAPDWLLGVLFGAGGMGGMYLGARLQKHVPAKAIKWMLAGVIIFTASKYLLEYTASF